MRLYKNIFVRISFLMLALTSCNHDAERVAERITFDKPKKHNPKLIEVRIVWQDSTGVIRIFKLGDSTTAIPN